MPPNKEFEQAVKRDVQARVREGVKAVLEEILEEEMTEHLPPGGWLPGAHPHQARRRAQRPLHQEPPRHSRAGKIERLEVPRDRQGEEFVTELFERYKRTTGDVEEAVLEMYLLSVNNTRTAAQARRYPFWGPSDKQEVSR